MDLINHNIDIEKMYKYQLDEKKDAEYEKYLKYLNLYFQESGKKDIYKKEYKDGKYILIDKKNPSKQIILTPSKFINMHELYFELKRESELALLKISNLISSKSNITDENRDDFDKLKKLYKSYHNKIIDIDNINNTFYEEIGLLLKEKIEKTNDLQKFYIKRTIEYEKIETMINEVLKKNLIIIYKKNKKIPSMQEINKIAKEYNIPSKELEKWFGWIESIYHYGLVNMELYKINNLIEEKEKTFLNNTNYLIIEKPVIIS